jgi:hypothetical protein
MTANLAAHLIAAMCLPATYVGTHAACDAAAVRLRLWRHRRLTRRHGTMLRRAQAARSSS